MSVGGDWRSELGTLQLMLGTGGLHSQTPIADRIIKISQLPHKHMKLNGAETSGGYDLQRGVCSLADQTLTADAAFSLAD